MLVTLVSNCPSLNSKAAVSSMPEVKQMAHKWQALTLSVTQTTKNLDDDINLFSVI